MLCPYCRIGKLYIAETDKEGNIKKVKCIICEKVFAWNLKKGKVKNES